METIYTPFFQICDTCLPCLLDVNNWMLDPQKVPKKFPIEKETSLGSWNSVFNQLYTDEYIKEALFNKEGIKYFILSTKGRIFIKNGGYQHLFAEQEFNSNLEVAQISSVINTNKSVSDTNEIQRKSLIATGIIILVGVVFQIASSVIAYNEYKIHKAQRIKQEMKETSDSLIIHGLKQEMISIRKSLDELQKRNGSFNSPTPRK